jgi:hypothetical protein
MLAMEIIVAVVAGLFSLLGAFAGSALGRRTEYDKWLRQEKSAAFSEYLRQLYAVQRACLDLIYCDPGQEDVADMRIAEHFWGLTPQENIVRLYLQTEDRDTFSHHAKELWNATSRVLNQSTRHSKTETSITSIQNLFERSLHG